MVQQQAAERAAWAASVRQATGQRVTTGQVLCGAIPLASMYAVGAQPRLPHILFQRAMPQGSI
jgi:hypothetical protein